MTLKTCTKCKVEKGAGEFCNLMTKCRMCLEEEDRSTVKVCSKCGVERDKEDFYKSKIRGKIYARPYCKACSNTVVKRQWRKNNPKKHNELCKRYNRSHKQTKKSIQLKNKYGISYKQYNEMLVKQNGVCAICKKPEHIRGRWGAVLALVVDHKHDATKKIRGLLCQDCNVGIARLQDDPQICRIAAEYLENSI